MSKESRAFVPLLLGIAMAIGLLLGLGLGGKEKQQRSNRWEKIDQVLQYVEQDYVDSVSRNSLEEDAISYLLQRLDPHSYYISEENVARVNEPLNGGFQGIGIEFNFKSDTVYVIKTIKGGPADLAGLLAGDRLIKADTTLIAGQGMATADVMKLLKGESGSEVKVQVLRGEQQLAYTIVRGDIELSSIESAYLLNDSTVYVRLERFAKNTYNDFMEASLPLKTEFVKHFVLDLRGNGGGYLDAAVAISDEFLKEDLLITYTEGKSRPRSDFVATNKGSFEDLSLHVLIDGYTASASEIIAGAMQDHERATLYGKRSYGKGLVQEQNEWQDGSATRLTVARYYTPNGRSIQRPYQSIGSENTAQVDTAAEVIGGIVPDVEVNRDTAGVTWLYAEIVHRGWILDFVYFYRDQHLNELEDLSFEVFENEMSDSLLLLDFRAFLIRKGFEINESEWLRSSPNMALRIRGLLARGLYSENEYFKIMNTSDEGVRAILNRIKKAEA
jgi:carboxyl-terminal processing protease